MYIRDRNVARWYALSFKQGRPPAIEVAVWEPYIDRLCELFRKHRGITHLMETWGFESFEPNLRQGFGFNGAMRTTRIRSGYVRLKAPLIHAEYATAVSFGVLLGTLSWLHAHAEDLFVKEPAGDPDRLQLMTLECGVVKERSMHAAPLGGWVSPAFADWVDRIHTERSRIPVIEEAMWRAWNAISAYRVRKERGPNPFMGFSSRFGENGSFFLSCLGNACDISTTEWWEREAGMGHELGCHNLDSPIQQLSLLAGLAALHDIADNEIDLRPPS